MTREQIKSAIALYTIFSLAAGRDVYCDEQKDDTPLIRAA